MSEAVYTDDRELDKLLAEREQRQREEAIREAQEKRRKGFVAYELLLPPASDRTDAGQAERFVKYAEGKIAYNRQWGWSCYTRTEDGGGVWESSEVAAINLYLKFTMAQRLALVESQLMNDESTAKEAEAASKFIRQYRSNNAVKAVLSLAASMVTIPPEAWDKEPYLLNTQNGVVNLANGELLQSKPEQLMRHICACKYTATPKGEQMWNDTLNRIIIGEDGAPDAELQVYLQSIAGFAAIGKSYEVLYMCYSDGGSGKSTMWDTIAYTLGSYAVSMVPKLLTSDEKHGDDGSARFLIQQLDGARLALMSESEDGDKLSTKQLKLVTANHKLSAEKKHKDRYEFTPTHTLVMHTNNIPRVRSVDDGTWDRLKIIPYRARIRGTAADDKQYREKLKAQAAEAVLQWIVTGAASVIAMNEKLTEPQCVKSIVEQQRGESAVPDSVSAFVEDMCNTTGNRLSVSASGLWGAYALYCQSNGFNAVGTRKLKQVLCDYFGIEHGHEKDGSHYYGIELLH